MRSQRSVRCGLAALAAVLSACATPASRIQKHRAEFDAYPPDVQQKIRDAQADVGFTREQVALALGRPDHIETGKTADAAMEVWVYGPGGGDARWGLGFGMMSGGPVSLGTSVDVGAGGGGGDRVRVVFQNGIVTRVYARHR